MKQKAQILAMMGGAAGLKKMKAKKKKTAAKPADKVAALKASENKHDSKIAALKKQKAQILAMMKNAKAKKSKMAAAKPEEKISALKASESKHDSKIAALKKQKAQILAMMGGAAGLKKLKAKRKAAAAKPDEKISA